MPNTSSSKKRVRQSETRTLRNKVRRSAMRTAIRQFREAVEAGDKATAQSRLVQVYTQIDKATKRHILHPNTAANRKSKLAKRVGAL